MKKKISQLSIEIDFREISAKLEKLTQCINALNDAMKDLETVKEIPIYQTGEEEDEQPC